MASQTDLEMLAQQQELEALSLLGGTEEDWQSESDKFTDELDVQAAIEARDAAARTVERENEILNSIMNTTGPTISIDGTPFNIQQAIDSGASSTQILNSILTGDLIRTDIDNSLEAGSRSFATGLTNFLGMPGDIIGAAGSGLEGLGRKGINLAAEAAGNVNFTVSENPQDFTFSSPNPAFGGQWIRDTLNKLGSDYVNIDQFPEAQRPYAQVGRVVGENVALARLPFTLANMGVATANPLVKQAIKDPKKFAMAETGAIAGAAGLAGGAEALGFGDNPFVMMGAEVIGAITGGSPKTVVTTPRLALQFGKYVAKSIGSRFSDKATNERALNHILTSTNTARAEILKEIENLKKSGDIDPAIIEELTAQADAFTPERLMADLEAGLASATEGRPMVRANLPSGTLSGNPALAAIQRKMMGDSPEFSAAVMNEVSATLDSMMAASDLLARAGNTEAADVLRKKAFQQAIDATLARSTGEVAERLKAFSGTDNFRASQLAQGTLYEAKTNMREMETFLWDRIDKKAPIDGTNIGKAIASIRENKLLDGMTIAGGGQIDAAINIIANKIQRGEPLDTGEVLKFRSIMLEQSRRAAGADDYGQAGIFDALATSAVDDLSALDGAAGDTISLARAFSSELNQRFTRYFPKDVLSKEAKGGTSIESEMVLDTGFGTGGDQAALNFQQLQTAASDATTFADDINNIKARDEAQINASSLGDDGSRTNPVPATQSDNVADPTDVDPSKMMPTDDDIIPEVKVSGTGRMVNKDTLYYDVPSDPNNPVDYTIYGANRPRPDAPEVEATDEFKLNEGGNSTEVVIKDDVRQDLGAQMFSAQEDFLRSTVYKLRDSTTGQISSRQIDDFLNNNARLLNDFPNLRQELIGYADAERAAARIVEDLSRASSSEKLPNAISDTLTSDNPTEAFARLAAEAQGLPDAMTDFRLATMDVLFAASRGADGKPDFVKLANNMGKPLSGRTGDLTIMDLMAQNNVISPQEQEILGQMVAEGIRIQRSLTDPNVFNQVIQGTPDIQKNVARIIGANLGVMFGRGDASLQAAAIGSEFVKRQIDKLPLAADTKRVETLMRNPALLLELLSKNPARAKSGMQTAKELFAKYQDSGMSNAEIARELTKQGALAVGDAAARNTRTATVGALQGDSRDEEPPEVRSLDEQMMNLQ
jgi:hypothetical protein